jgi:hypothetical protein
MRIAPWVRMYPTRSFPHGNRLTMEAMTFARNAAWRAMNHQE